MKSVLRYTEPVQSKFTYNGAAWFENELAVVAPNFCAHDTFLFEARLKHVGTEDLTPLKHSKQYT